MAPLDWGLGHATRCIPVIKELLNQRCVVIIAASGSRRALLAAEFPSLIFEEIPDYGIKYGKNRALTIFRLIFSLPKILIRVKQEKAWLRQFCSRESPDLVISDNRYGLYDPRVPSVFITHQLLIRTPFGVMADRLVQLLNYPAIRHFSRCWVPDEQDDGASLAGGLSHPLKKPAIPLRYIGWLSRFGAADMAPVSLPADAETSGPERMPLPTPVDLLVLLSGPEPQRTLLEKTLLEQVAGLGIHVTLVRGLPGRGKFDLPGGSGGTLGLPVLPSNIEVFDHLPALLLERQMKSARLILARAGYSTIMDLMRLGKKAILIPTPGQTEQEYLGSYLAGRGWAYCMEQNGFSLADALSKVREQPLERPKAETAGLLAGEIREILEAVRGKKSCDERNVGGGAV